MQLQSSDEEAPVEEEAEALRLQRLKAASLRPEDFELSDEDDDGADGLPDENERSLQVHISLFENKYRFLWSCAIAILLMSQGL